MLFVIVAGLFLGVSFGAFNLLAYVLEVPHKATLKTMLTVIKLNMPRKQRFEILKTNLANFLSRFIRINEYKREEMFEKLNCSQRIMTPEEFIAGALAKPILIGIGALLIFAAGQALGIASGIIKLLFSFCSIALVILAILMYFKEQQALDEGLKEKREEIELELPRFVSIIAKNIRRNKDVLGILDRYQETAGRHLKSELKITIADMKSGNEETALRRLENRINSSSLSDIVRGLIAVLQGNNTESYWENLEIRLGEAARQALEAQALKIPGKIKKLTVALVLCFVGTYIVVFGIYISNNISVFG